MTDVIAENDRAGTAAGPASEFLEFPGGSVQLRPLGVLDKAGAAS